MLLTNPGQPQVEVLQSDNLTFRNRAKVSNNGEAFAGAISAQSAVATYPQMQLYNPVGSGVVAVVTRVIGSSNADGHLYLIQNETELNSTTATPENRKHGGAAAECQIGEADTGSFTGANGSYDGYILANTTLHLPLDYPMILEEGDGCVLTAGGTNYFMTASFEWLEL